MTRADTDHRRLCHALFDAIEHGDIDGRRALLRAEMTMWFNVTGQESTREDNLAALAKGSDLHRRRRTTTASSAPSTTGSSCSTPCNVVAHDGTKVPLSACLVAEVHDGKIVKLFEYLDSGKFGRR